MTVHDIPLHTLAGEPASLGDLAGSALLVVNVASKCGLTPQYAGLERLHERYADRGFTVRRLPLQPVRRAGAGHRRGDRRTFCSTTYGVTFPMFEKIDVNGAGRHPLYNELTAVPDAEGEAGDIQWNFEKFLVAAGRHGPRPVPPADRPGGPCAGRGDRGQPARLSQAAQGVPGDGPAAGAEDRCGRGPAVRSFPGALPPGPAGGLAGWWTHT